MCGFDSVPSDLGAFLCVQRLKANGYPHVKLVNEYIKYALLHLR